jgi:1,4-alpha-glucan branching enzyme
MPPVTFTYYTGLERPFWFNPRLSGSWNGWNPVPMDVIAAADGCPAFRTTVDLDADGSEYRWGVFVDSAARNNIWAVMDEAGLETTERHRSFVLAPGDGPRHEHYFFTHNRRLGAHKDGQGRMRFAVWAPNARAVEVVFGDPAHGYIPDDHEPGNDTIALRRAADGVWESDRTHGPFETFVGRPYMFRITRGNGDVRYRTDLYSRHQIGRGNIDPAHEPYDGNVTRLDGTKSCSVVVDPDTIAGVPAGEFWRDELTHELPLPAGIENLVIYEVHVGSLGFGETDATGQPRPGTLADAAAPLFLDHLQDLGVNAIELLPIMEFAGDRQWGYATSHFHALESSAGGRNALKRLVRACHQRGIAVLLDVVFNHYHHDAERAQWNYDDTAPDRNLYYWYEGRPTDYPEFDAAVEPDRRGHGGYLDNVSTGFAPRYSEEMVRKLMIGSAVAMVEEFHIDGFRVDQTSSIRAYNVLHANGRSAGAANAWGAKFLRQFIRTVKLVDPHTVVIAEDHETGEAEQQLTRPTDQGGLGFDAAWFSSFYHNLIGDAAGHDDAGRLIRFAGFGGDFPLRFDFFAGALQWSKEKKVVYGESHDEAGNAKETARTIVTAANGAPLLGETRRFAEARCRFAFAMAVLSAGTPMLLSGDEIAATKMMKYNDPIGAKEDLFGERVAAGAKLFACYSDLIKFRLRNSAVRSRNLTGIQTSNDDRTISFVRNGELLVAGSLANTPLRDYRVPMKDGQWREVFNSDSELYGGDNVGNEGRTLEANGELLIVIPANGVVVFRRV